MGSTECQNSERKREREKGGAVFELIHQLSERLLSQFAVRFLPSQAGSVPAAPRVVSHLFAKKKKSLRAPLASPRQTDDEYVPERNKRGRM